MTEEQVWNLIAEAVSHWKPEQIEKLDALVASGKSSGAGH